MGYRFVSGVLVLASIIGMAFALYLEHGPLQLNPCPSVCVPTCGTDWTGGLFR